MTGLAPLCCFSARTAREREHPAGPRPRLHDGTYERAAVTEWLRDNRYGVTSLLTGATLMSKE